MTRPRAGHKRSLQIKMFEYAICRGHFAIDAVNQVGTSIFFFLLKATESVAFNEASTMNYVGSTILLVKIQLFHPIEDEFPHLAVDGFGAYNVPEKAFHDCRTHTHHWPWMVPGGRDRVRFFNFP